MKTLSWKTISEKNFTSEFAFGKKRLAAFERVKDSAVRKAKIIVPENAAFELPVLHAEPGIRLIEITQKPFSRLSLKYIADAAGEENSCLILRINLEEGAALESAFGMFGGSASTLIVETNLLGAGSAVREKTLYFGNENQVFDMFSNTVMHGANTAAEIDSKGILTGKAAGRFDGSITMKESAKQGTARLLEHTLLLSPDARMNAIPGLTIETNDVVATHSASMTRVDDEQLFYCKSRGIEERDAVRLIAEGFLNSPDESMNQLIQKKLCTL